MATQFKFRRFAARLLDCLAKAGLPAAAAMGLAAMPGASSALAQLMLPGALHAMPPTGSDKGGGGGPDPNMGGTPQAKARPVTQKIPEEGTLVGHDLTQDGVSGRMAFRIGPAKTLEIAGLTLEGEQISHPGEPCRVDVVAAAPIATKFADRRNGLSRYTVEIEACPFAFEVLDGAVLVTRKEEGCEFAAADCRVDPTGLWGPRGNSFDESQLTQFERARGQAEANMRANFRALLAIVGKDKAAIKAIAGEQAGFSSKRTVICRDYAGEDVHAFCALRITQARTFDLEAQYETQAKDHAGDKSSKATAEKKLLRSYRSQATTSPRQTLSEP